jgi:hypothetical protein
MHPLPLLSLCLAFFADGASSHATKDPALVAVAPSTTPAMLRAMETVQEHEIRADLAFIASDEMQGRDTPSEGLVVTARYLRARLQRLGWQPGAKDGSYFHLYDLANRRLLKEGTKATILGTGESASKSVELAFDRDAWLSGGMSVAAGELEGSALWLGAGTQECFDAGDWKERVAFVREPSDQRERQRVFGRARREELKALVMVAAAGEDLAGRMANTTRRLVEGAPRYVEPKRGDGEGKEGGEAKEGGERRDRRASPSSWSITHDAFQRAMALASVAPDALGDQPRELGFTWRETRAFDEDGRVQVENVVGFWPGSDPILKQETIIVSAHYDHVGVSDGQIHNGADDNGSGTAGMLALAEALAEHGPLRRSVALIWVSGEEKGLWGSRAWCADPWLPGDARPACNINMDMIGRNAPDMLLVTPTKKLAEHYNAVGDLALKLSPAEGFPELGSADQYWSRSDQASFAKLGIPAIFLFSDVHADYHQPGDDVEKVDCDKIRRVVRLVARVIDGLQGDTLPAVGR